MVLWIVRIGDLYYRRADLPHTTDRNLAWKFNYQDAAESVAELIGGVAEPY